MNRLNQNLTPEQRQERARQNRKWRQSAARKYEQSQREDPDVGKYRDIGSNRERRRKRFARAFESEARVRFVQRLPCLVCRKCPTEVAHVRSRAAGGTAADTVPLCALHHQAQHHMGIQSFAEYHDIDLAAEARAVEEAWRERQG